LLIFISAFQIPWNPQNLLLINIFFKLVFVNSAPLRFISLPACRIYPPIGGQTGCVLYCMRVSQIRINGGESKLLNNNLFEN